MKRSSLIGHVIEAYSLCRRSQDPADRVITDFYRARRYLGAADRRFVSEAVFGMLRNGRLLEVLAGTALGTSTPQSQLLPHYLYAAYAARFAGTERESVLQDVLPLRDSFLSEAECRKFLDDVSSASLSPDIRKDPVRRIGVTYSHPDFVVREWIKTFGEEETDALCAAMNQPAPITVRVNTLRTTVENCRLSLEQEGIETEAGRHSPVALVLRKRVNVDGLRTFRKGFFEIQDEGSQLVGFLCDPVPGQTVVDACAGSGGKSLHLAAMMENRGTIYAWDADRGRLRRMDERIRRARVSIVHPDLTSDGSQSRAELHRAVDRLLIDAPCSGSGTFRRNPGLKLELKEEMVSRRVKTQREILDSSERFVKPGGRLIYATCSLLRMENEEIVDWFLRNHADFQIIPAHEILDAHGIVLPAEGPFLRLLPHRHSTDGFFAAVLGKG